MHGLSGNAMAVARERVASLLLAEGLRSGGQLRGRA